jgi:hypothetical protein
MDRVLDMLERIQQLQKRVRETEPDSLEHKALLSKIRIAMDEYQEIMDETIRTEELEAWILDDGKSSRQE